MPNKRNLSACLALIVAVLLLLAACNESSNSASADQPLSGQPDNSTPSETGVTIDYDIYNVTGIELDDEPNAPNYIGSYYVPYVGGLGDEAFEQYVSEYLREAIQKPVSEFEKNYNEFRVAVSMEENGEIKKNLQATAEQYEYMSKIRLLTTDDNYFAVAENIYENTGGVHPDMYVKTYNIDIPGKKFIMLGDIFKDSGWKSVIENKLGEMAKTDEYKEKLMPDTAVSIINENNFYLADGQLIIHYQPYELAPYAAGFIVFNIPLSDIGDILKDEYATTHFKDEISRQNLFDDAFNE